MKRKTFIFAAMSVFYSSNMALATMPPLTPQPAEVSEKSCRLWAKDQDDEAIAIWGIQKSGVPSKSVAVGRLTNYCLGHTPPEIVGFGTSAGFEEAFCKKYPAVKLCLEHHVTDNKSLSGCTPSPPGAGFNYGATKFILSNRTYAATQDLEGQIKLDYGPSAQMTDWGTLTKILSDDQKVHEFIEAVGLPLQHGNSSCGNVFVSVNGAKQPNGFVTFIARHDGRVPPNWAVLDSIGNHLIDLGRWNYNSQALIAIPEKNGLGSSDQASSTNSPITSPFFSRSPSFALTSSHSKPSFPCDKATKLDEITICQDDRLAELDVLRSAAFVEAKKESPKEALSDARKFLEYRASCGNDRVCLLDTMRYGARKIIELQWIDEYRKKLVQDAVKDDLSVKSYSRIGKRSSFALSSKAESATLIDIQNVDTDHATAMGRITSADFSEYCERDPGGMRQGGMSISKCIEVELAKTPTTVFNSKANCARKTLNLWNGSWTLMDIDGQEIWRWKTPEGEEIESYSRTVPAEEQFKLLCPNTFAELRADSAQRQSKLKDIEKNKNDLEAAKNKLRETMGSVSTYPRSLLNPQIQSFKTGAANDKTGVEASNARKQQTASVLPEKDDPDAEADKMKADDEAARVKQQLMKDQQKAAMAKQLAALNPSPTYTVGSKSSENAVNKDVVENHPSTAEGPIGAQVGKENQDQKRKEAIALAQKEGPEFLAESETEWYFKTTKDKFSGTIVSSVESQQKNENGVVARVIGECLSDRNVHFTVLIVDEQGRPDVDIVRDNLFSPGFGEMGRNAASVNIRVNNDIRSGMAVTNEFANKFSVLNVLGPNTLSQKPTKENVMLLTLIAIAIPTVAFDTTWGAKFEFSTNRGPIIISIPLFDVSIKRLIAECFN